jgi:hypothetical protein
MGKKRPGNRSGPPPEKVQKARRAARIAARRRLQQRPEPGDRAAQAQVAHPRKRMYRARAHSNPLNDNSFNAPSHPDEMDWCGSKPAPLRLRAHAPSRPRPDHDRTAPRRSSHFPAFFKDQQQGAEGGSGEGASSSGEQPMVRFADVGCGFGGLTVRCAAQPGQAQGPACDVRRQRASPAWVRSGGGDQLRLRAPARRAPRSRAAPAAGCPACTPTL